MKTGLAAVISAALGTSAVADTVTRADFDTAVDAADSHGRSEGIAEGRAAGHKEGVTAERSRISAIMRGENVKGREATALALALDTDMSAEQAAAVLKATPAAKTSMLDGNVPQPKIGTGADDEKPGDKLAAAVQTRIKRFMPKAAA